MVKLPSSLSAAAWFAYAAIFMAPFGWMLASAGYHALEPGNLRYQPNDGPERILSGTNDPEVFWGAVIGFSALGVLLLIAAAVCLAIAIRVFLLSRRAARATSNQAMQRTAPRSDA